MSGDLKDPPTLSDDVDYADWKIDLEIWELYTSLAKNRRGPALYLSLKGKARDCIRGLTKEQIGAENGVETIKKRLDEVMQSDENMRTFTCFKTFYDYRRPAGCTIQEFIIKYERLYCKLSAFNIELPEGVQAFFLLTAANISEDYDRLAMATVKEMTYQEMKITILKIFNDTSGGNNSVEPAPSIKTEPVFKATHDAGYRGGYRGSYRGSRGRGRGSYRSTQMYDTNPRDREGKVMKCYKCGSERHFARYCDKKEENTENKQSKKEDVHITLLSEDRKMSRLVRESLGMAILDTGCSKTVCGEIWLNEYEETLSPKEQRSVVSFPSKTSFIFGDGVEVLSERSVKIPVKIGSKSLSIQADVVKNELPLLLSRQSMKRGEVVIDTKRNTAEVLGEEIKLVSTSSGHICLPLTNKLLVGEMACRIILHTTSLAKCTREQKRRKALKLHKQFSHASKEKLKKLLKQSEDFNDVEFLEMVEKCCDQCEICRKFAKPKLRPIVCMPLSDKFNGVVCMDLKEHIHNKSWIFHLIDSATKLSAALLINNKETETICQAMFSGWITYFGCPGMFLSDNGGEFDSHVFREMGEKLNVKVATTAAESPFSNGIVERNNAIIYESMMKTVADLKCKPEIALASAVAAKNSLASYGGVSPNMLVFGHNTNFPSVLTDELPALSTDQAENDVIRINIEARHKAREKYIKAESSEKIKRALRSKVRNFSDVKYESGEKVYYRRKNFKGWKGPATVIGVDGKIVFLRHGGSSFKSHSSSIMRTDKFLQIDPVSQKKEIQKWYKDDVAVTNSKVSYSNSEEDGEDEEEVEDTEDEEEVDDTEDEEADAEDDEEFSQEETDAEEEEISQEEAEGEEDENGEDAVEHAEESGMKSNSELPLRNHYVRYKLKDSDDWIKAKILSKQKKTSIYSDWVNLKNEGEAPHSMNWKDVERWQNVPHPELIVLLTKEEEYDQDTIDAKNKELEKLIENKVYTSVPYTGQKLISSKWVFTEKYKDGQRVLKARLVARGFEEDDKQLRTDSPTCSREGMRMVYLTAVMMSWKLQSLDFTSAFLQGEEIDRRIFLKPPRDVCPKTEVWSLRKCLYGLNDAPRSWYMKVKKALISLGAVQSLYDSALFIWHGDDGTLKGIVASHVDDFIYCGTDAFQSEVMQKLRVTFKIGAECSGNFKYVGLNILQSRGEVKIDQSMYIKNIEPISISKERKENPDSLLSPEEKAEVKQLAGQMIWATSQTRPDVAYEACQIANTGKTPTVKMILEANRAVSKMKKKDVSLIFKKLGNPEDLAVEVYSDATHASLNDGSSQGAFVIFLKGRDGKTVPMSWRSKRIPRVTKSPLASEASALGDAADAGYLIASMTKEVFNLKTAPPIHCKTDSKSLVQTLHTSTSVSDQRLKVDIARLRQMTQSGEITVSWVRGSMQLSDPLTKHTASTTGLLAAISA